jgi:DNA-directed RNA polymerase I subunit RPA2
MSFARRVKLVRVRILNNGTEHASSGLVFSFRRCRVKVMRILQVPRRDYALAVQRNAFKNRGPLYSDKAVTMRCARPDQSTQTVRRRGGGAKGSPLPVL